jgi:hypothetical protein
MSSSGRVVVPVVIASGFATLFFGLGNLAARPGVEAEQIAALRAEIEQLRNIQPAVTGTSGLAAAPVPEADGGRAALVEDVKRQLQSEMGLLPLNLIRDRRQSFVELYSYDDRGASSYGTAGYLGNGYFITVKHGVIALGQEGVADPREITSIKLITTDAGSTPASWTPATRASRWIQATGPFSRSASPSICRRSRSTSPTASSSRTRSSASATTTRRASSSPPAMSASARRTA